MKKGMFAFILVAFLLPAARQVSAQAEKITQEELVRRTQEMFDAVAVGNQEPWKKYIAGDVLYFDEKGRNMNKQQLVADITPLPKGYSGTIKMAKAQSHIEGDVAILSYDLDETETIYGQNMTARYHGTDTWMRRNGSWQIVASQQLRYYEDPAPGTSDPKRMADCIGIYELVPGITMAVTLEENRLYAKRSDRGAKDELIPETTDIYFRKGVEGRRLFRRDSAGRVDALIDRRNNEDVVWKRIKQD